MTDKEFLLRFLSDGEPHCLNDILRRSFLERGCGLTVHSRACDLRRDGHPVVNWRDGQRGAGSWYQLRPLEAAAGVQSSGATAAAPSVDSPSAAASSRREAVDAGGDWHPAARQDGQLVLDTPEFHKQAAA